MQITGTEFNYYFLCRRKLWLFMNGIDMEQNSDAVADGTFLHENSYRKRSEKYEEVSIDGIKLDYYDHTTHTIHEIKRSNKIERAHIAQVKFYMFVLESHGVCDVKGILEYPLLHETKDVFLTDNDRKKIKDIMKDIESISTLHECPAAVKKGYCKNCSYYEFCFTNEVDV